MIAQTASNHTGRTVQVHLLPIVPLTVSITVLLAVRIAQLSLRLGYQKIKFKLPLILHRVTPSVVIGQFNMETMAVAQIKILDVLTVLSRRLKRNV